MNLVLCGMMGAGKSSVGERIATLTGRRWLDTDQIITERFGSIPDIFKTYGEAHFRALETEIVKELVTKDGLVISTGGGLVLLPENRELLKRKGKLIYLRASLETLLSRVSAQGRPLLEGERDIAERLKDLLAKRTPVYEQATDNIIDTDGKTIEEVATDIVALSKGGVI